MNPVSSGQELHAEKRSVVSPVRLSAKVTSALTKVSVWITDRNIPFLVMSIGIIVMLLWAGSFKLTRLGAQGITPLVTHSPLISWHFKLFGPYIGSDIIGLTEFTAAILLIVGYFKAVAGIIGGLITTGMFFITSTMIITTRARSLSIMK